MTRRLRALLASCLAAALAFPALSRAQSAPAAPAAPAAKKPDAPRNQKKEPADVGAVKGNPDDPNNGFLKRHEGFLKDLAAKNGKVGVLFVGDSITDGWRGGPPRGGKEVFEKNYGRMDPLNIGIGGDRTQHVIWRLQNGEVAGIAPKVTMLMIGTNNLGGNTNEEIVDGIKGCVKEIQKQMPSTKVLLLGVFPRGEKADNPARARIKAINEQIAKLDDGGKTVRYLDIGDKFLEPDGTLPKSIMPDALHPNKKGYEIWTEAVKGPITEMLK
jgi:lysophospholipase L1-like esterase